MPLSRAVAGAGVGLLSLMSVLAACSDGSGTAQRPARAVTPPQDTAAPGGLQGPPLTPWVVQHAGRRVVCPTGAVPAVDLRAVDVSPGLVGGTTMVRGTYVLALRGAVVNATDSPVVVDGVVVRVGGRAWSARTTAPARVVAGGAGPLVVRGAYRSPGHQQARVVAGLRWHWADPTLRACGTRGLLEDD